MSRRVTFKLYDRNAAGNPIDELALSLAFQRHCQHEFGITDDLNIMVKKVWLKFLRDAVDKSATASTELSKAGLGVEPQNTGGVAGEVPSAGETSEVTSEVSQGDTPANGSPAARIPEGDTSDAVAEPQAVDGEIAITLE